MRSRVVHLKQKEVSEVTGCTPKTGRSVKARAVPLKQEEDSEVTGCTLETPAQLSVTEDDYVPSLQYFQQIYKEIYIF